MPKLELGQKGAEWVGHMGVPALTECASDGCRARMVLFLLAECGRSWYGCVKT